MKETIRRLLVDRPLEFWAGVLSPIGGIVQLAAEEYPPSILRAVGPNLSAIWSLYLTVGGIFLLIGLLAQRMESQRFGNIIMATVCFAYAIAVLVNINLAGLLGAGFLVVLALGFATRAIFLRSYLQRGV